MNGSEMVRTYQQFLSKSEQIQLWSQRSRKGAWTCLALGIVQSSKTYSHKRAHSAPKIGTLQTQTL